VFCPKCSEEMEQINGVWACRRGEMPLSLHMSTAFTDVYVLKTRTSDRRATFKWGGVWYCPGCGVPAEEREGSVKCNRCGRFLDEFLYQLIEHHPHKMKDGSWR
jgi:hypothetical protein